MRDVLPDRPWAVAFACWCGGVGVFQAALALGAPWGAAAWGGRNAGVLPRRLRLASAAAVPALGGVAALAAAGPPTRPRRRVLLGAAVYASVGVVANGLSPSAVERAIWTPGSALGSLLALRAWREAGP